MKTLLLTFGLILFFTGLLKFILNPLLNNKPWFMTFNKWYARIMTVETVLFFGTGLAMLVGSLK